MRITLVIPAHNEGAILEKTVAHTHRFFEKNRLAKKHTWNIVISDNGSTDLSHKIGKRLAKKNSDKAKRRIYITYLNVHDRGKGLAISTAWNEYPADIYAFMDADLATHLSAFPFMAEQIEKGEDIIIGSRFANGSQVKRSFLRWIYAYGYSICAKIFTKTSTKDLPCGAKMFSKKVVEEILPQIKNKQWFFDSEFVLRAEKSGYKIKEIPIDWNPKRYFSQRSSKTASVKIIKEYIKGLISFS